MTCQTQEKAMFKYWYCFWFPVLFTDPEVLFSVKHVLLRTIYKDIFNPCSSKSKGFLSLFIFSVHLFIHLCSIYIWTTDFWCVFVCLNHVSVQLMRMNDHFLWKIKDRKRSVFRCSWNYSKYKTGYLSLHIYIYIKTHVYKHKTKSFNLTFKL